MLFRDNDLLGLLFQHSVQARGAYDQFNWKVSYNNALDEQSRITSVHEFFHNELNNTTTYGFVLTAYAYLSQENAPNMERYRETLLNLIKRCQEAHEVFATYLSMLVLTPSGDEAWALSQLKDNPLYLGYYRQGAKLVKQVSNSYLKQQLFTVIIRICFQCDEIANAVKDHAQTFAVAEIPQLEYPDQRLEYLDKRLPRNFVNDCIRTFLDAYIDANGCALIRAAWEGREVTQALLAPENDAHSEALMKWTYNALDAFLRNRNSRSFLFSHYLEYVQELLPVLNAIYPFSESPHPLVMNSDPADIERNLLLGFENETLILQAKPLSCVILRPEEVHEDMRELLFRGVIQPPYIFITGRSSRLLSNQYYFPYPEDRILFENLTLPFTAIRLAVQEEQNRTIFYILFEQPKELIEFLGPEMERCILLGCVGVSVLGNPNWRDTWNNFLSEKCKMTCLLLDVSPTYCIDDLFLKYEKTYYDKAILKSHGETQTGIFLQIEDAGETIDLLVAPCSDIVCQAIFHYAKTKYPDQYQLGLQLPAEQMQLMSIILSCIFRGEQEFHFYSSLSNFIEHS